MKDGLPDSGSISAGVGILILAVLFGLLIFLLLVAPGFIGGARIGNTLSNVPYPPVVADNITGYADLSGNIAGIPVSNPDPDPEMLGAVLVPIKLQYFTSSAKGPAPIDMSKTTILVTTAGKTEELFRSDKRPVTKSSWTFAQKKSAIQDQNANQDNVLDPNEIFVLFVYPGNAVPAGNEMSIQVNMQSQWPFIVNITVPKKVQPAMNLGIPRQG